MHEKRAIQLYGFSFMISLRLQTVLCYNKPAAKNVGKRGEKQDGIGKYFAGELQTDILRGHAK